MNFQFIVWAILTGWLLTMLYDIIQLVRTYHALPGPLGTALGMLLFAYGYATWALLRTPSLTDTSSEKEDK